LALITPPGPQNGTFGFEVLNEGLIPNNIYEVSIGVETDWEDWEYPLGLYTVEIFSCGSDCGDQHGVIFSTGLTNFTISTSSSFLIN